MGRFRADDTLACVDSWRRVAIPALPGNGEVPWLRDTATGSLVPAATGRTAKIYACGITPYDATHIGHAATYTAWDLLVRALHDAGVTVSYTQNVTDVDDPLLERADRDGQDWRDLAAREIELYRADMTALRTLPPGHLVGAVEAMPMIDRFNALLRERGALYHVDSDVYFAKSADPWFGSLSGPGTPSGYSAARMATLAAERGGDPERPGKKDPLDPLVWRAARPGEPSWPSSFGPGRPGWHVECAAIATEYLGVSFDVQAGGNDLIFPHHEMSASHARVAFAPGEPVFARAYLHSGMVSYRGEKMSKSLGNLVFVNRLLADGTDPVAVRLALLAHHYRADWEWTAGELAAAVSRLARWRAAISSAAHVPADAASGRGPASEAAVSSRAPSRAAAPPAATAVLAEVRAALADDLDAPRALAAIDRWADDALAGQAPSEAGAALIRHTADALLGVAL